MDNPKPNVSWKDFLLNESGYFFKLLPNHRPLTREARDQILHSLLTANGALPEPQFFDHLNSEISVRSVSGIFFQRKAPAANLYDSERFSEYFETKNSFLFLIQTRDDYIVCFKKNVKGFNEIIEQYATPLSSNTLKNGTLLQGRKVQGIRAINSKQNEYSLRTKSFVASDLSKADGSILNYQYVLNSFKCGDENGNLKVSFNTSNVSTQSSKVPIAALANWSAEICVAFNNVMIGTPSYLDTYAIEANYKEEVQKTNPLHLTILSSLTEGFFESGGGISKKGKHLKQVSRGELDWLLDRNLIVKKDAGNGKFWVFDELGKKLQLAPDLEIKFLRQKARLASSSLTKYLLSSASENFEYLHLEELLNESDWVVTQGNGQAFLYKGKFYKRDFFTSAVDIIASVLQPYREISKLSEEDGQLKPNDKEFPANSLFSFTETTLAKNHKSDILICDDRGDEWADFISVSSDELVFFHCKVSTSAKEGGKIPKSASKFHIIVAQAEKNIGNMVELREVMIKNKANGIWLEKYPSSQKKYLTQIDRIRKKSPSAPDTLESFRKAHKNPNLIRSVYLVVNFLSKTEFIHELSTKRDSMRGSSFQLAWLILELLSKLKEKGINLYIACKE